MILSPLVLTDLLFASAAEAMRRILVECARHKHSEKRCGGRRRVDFRVITRNDKAHQRRARGVHWWATFSRTSNCWPHSITPFPVGN
jgi:hypothetical protein